MSSNKHILVFGAGKSATVLIDYLKRVVLTKEWLLTLADGDLQTVKTKLGAHPTAVAVQLDILDEQKRRELIQQADVVISLMPPSLHYHVAVDCLAFGKNLLTASYVDEQIKLLKDEIDKKGLLFLCEMGLDPGIDHMSAMQLIHRIQQAGGTITSFRSHCGGLVAPESDDNPWHYKISWNPRNVVLAGKAGAVFLENGTEQHLSYEQLFDQAGQVQIPSLGSLAYYANRDSLSYIELYKLDTASTFIRTTLRHPNFCKGWARIVALKLTDETITYQTDGLTMIEFMQAHLKQHQLPISIDALSDDKNMQDQFTFLGLTENMLINKGVCTAASILQWRMEETWVLEPTDKDMIVMLHEIDYTLGDQQKSINSSLVVKGEDHLRTAMAKTVGLPLAIAAVLILEGKIKERGLHIPIIPSIYEPVLAMLADEGISFQENEN